MYAPCPRCLPTRAHKIRPVRRCSKLCKTATQPPFKNRGSTGELRSESPPLSSRLASPQGRNGERRGRDGRRRVQEQRLRRRRLLGRPLLLLRFPRFRRRRVLRLVPDVRGAAPAPPGPHPRRLPRPHARLRQLPYVCHLVSLLLRAAAIRVTVTTAAFAMPRRPS